MHHRRQRGRGFRGSQRTRYAWERSPARRPFSFPLHHLRTSQTSSTSSSGSKTAPHASAAAVLRQTARAAACRIFCGDGLLRDKMVASTTKEHNPSGFSNPAARRWRSGNEKHRPRSHRTREDEEEEAEAVQVVQCIAFPLCPGGSTRRWHVVQQQQQPPPRRHQPLLRLLSLRLAGLGSQGGRGCDTTTAAGRPLLLSRYECCGNRSPLAWLSSPTESEPEFFPKRITCSKINQSRSHNKIT